MKNFLFKIVVFIILLFVIDRLIGNAFSQLYNKSINYSAEYHNIFGKIVYNIEDDILIFGESKAIHAYNPIQIEDSLHMSTYNVSKNATEFTIQDYLINTMLQRHSPYIIIWELNPLCLTGCYSEIDIQNFKDLTPFYDNDTIAYQLINTSSLFEKYKMFSHAYRWNSNLFGIISVFLNRNLYKKGFFTHPSTGYQYPKKHKNIYPNNIEKERLEKLSSTIDNIKNHGSHLIVVSSPIYESSNLENTIQGKTFQQLLERKQVTWLNYHYAIQDSTCYHDYEHLNEKGTSLLMSFFIKDLKNSIQNQ